MPKIFTSEKQRIGETGENVAVRFLMKHGFSIVERNYTKKWGEIDIIAKKSGKLYFIEVKSVTRDTFGTVTRETHDKYRPEDNMHPWKMRRIARTLQTYLMSNKIPDSIEWQVDLLVVYLDLNKKRARVEVVSDIVL